MKVKTAELTDKALGWAVAEAAGRFGVYIQDPDYPGTSIMDIGLDADNILMVYEGGRRYNVWRPWEMWSQGGPIIDRFISYLEDGFDGVVEAAIFDDNPIGLNPACRHGPTKLIAAMRCYVASKLGDEVDVPQELLS